MDRTINTLKRTLIASEGTVTRSEFYLTDIDTSEEIRFCMTPESVSIKSTTAFKTYNIIERGEVKIPHGERLKEIKWSGILPGAGILMYPFVTTNIWENPQELIKTLERWRKNGEKLKILITQTPINEEVYIKNFDWEASGGQGNYRYSLSLTAAKELEVLTTAEAEAKKERLAAEYQQQLKERTRMKSKLGQRITELNNLWSVVKLLTGKGSLADVEAVTGRGDGRSVDDYKPGDDVIIYN